jgi:hypothetical protein
MPCPVVLLGAVEESHRMTMNDQDCSPLDFFLSQHGYTFERAALCGMGHMVLFAYVSFGPREA